MRKLSELPLPLALPFVALLPTDDTEPLRSLRTFKDPGANWPVEGLRGPTGNGGLTLIRRLLPDTDSLKLDKGSMTGVWLRAWISVLFWLLTTAWYGGGAINEGVSEECAE